ncbi:MAG: alpha/beta hydrolase [Casimicrobiaceae bacterium]
MSVAGRSVEHVAGVDVRITRAEGKPLLLLIRMASGGMGIWDSIWNDLARDYTVANFDLVGAAQLSTELSPRQRFLRLADRNVEVATALGFDSFHVFGWYGGAHVALACMHAHRDRVRSALLLDPFFELPDPRKLEKAVAFKRRLFESDDRTLYAYYWVMAGFSPRFLETRFDVVDRLVEARIAADKFVSLDPQRWLRWVRALRSNWLTASELAVMDIPTLVLATELDSWHAGPTVGMAEALVARLPAAQLATIGGHGTFFFIENPALLHQHAGEFLAASARAAAGASR